MRRTQYFIVFVIAFSSAIAQTTCSKSKIIGEWKLVEPGFSGHGHSTNIDSLKASIDTVGKPFWIFGDSVVKMLYGKRKKTKENYTLDETRCEIFYLNERKNKVKGRPWYIVYLDENYMLMKHEIPNGDYFYYFYYREKDK